MRGMNEPYDDECFHFRSSKEYVTKRRRSEGSDIPPISDISISLYSLFIRLFDVPWIVTNLLFKLQPSQLLSINLELCLESLQVHLKFLWLTKGPKDIPDNPVGQRHHVAA